MNTEPSLFEVFLTWLAFRIPGNGVYRGFAAGLPLSGGESVLDLGCGMGTVAHYAARRLPRGHLTCVDISQRWLAACERTLRGHKNVSFLLGDIGALPLPDDHFDVVYSHFVLHDIEDATLEKAFPALARALKAGGKLVFREPLADAAKIRFIEALAARGGLRKRSSSITDVALMGTVLENVYEKI